MTLLKNNRRVKEIIYILLAIFVPAIPIYFLSDFSDFIKSPITLIFIVLQSIMGSEVTASFVEYSVIVLSYFFLVLLGIKFFKKRAVIFLTAFSILNSLLALYIVSSFSGG